jgi:hypothetical protein
LKYTDPTGLFNYYNPHEIDGGYMDGVIDVDDEPYELIKLPGGGGSPTDYRNNTYPFQEISTEDAIQIASDFKLGISNYSWTDYGCKGWAAVVDLMFTMDALGSPIDIKDAVLYVDNQIGRDGLLSSKEIERAFQISIIENTEYDAQDFRDGNIAIQVISFGEENLSEDNLRNAVDYLSDNPEGFETLSLAIGRTRLDNIANTHFIALTDLHESDIGLEFSYVGSSKNDDQRQGAIQRRYRLGESEPSNLIYAVNRVDLIFVTQRRQEGIGD